jgi:hypothetical protein
VVRRPKVAVRPSLLNLQHHHNCTFQKPQTQAECSASLNTKTHKYTQRLKNIPKDSQIYTKTHKYTQRTWQCNTFIPVSMAGCIPVLCQGYSTMPTLNLHYT